MNEKKNFDYKRLHPFKWYILENFPFLEDSIDVLTNYQLFCKLGEMYNKEVDAINTLGIQVEGLTDWFDNLDVQEEINNKLDAMVEDGSMDEIINQEIFGDISNRIDILDNEMKTKTDGNNLEYMWTHHENLTQFQGLCVDDTSYYYYENTSHNLFKRGLINNDLISTYNIPSFLHGNDLTKIGDIIYCANFENKYINAYNLNSGNTFNLDCLLAVSTYGIIAGITKYDNSHAIVLMAPSGANGSTKLTECGLYKVDIINNSYESLTLDTNGINLNSISVLQSMEYVNGSLYILTSQPSMITQFIENENSFICSNIFDFHDFDVNGLPYGEMEGISLLPDTFNGKGTMLIYSQVRGETTDKNLKFYCFNPMIKLPLSRYFTHIGGNELLSLYQLNVDKTATNYFENGSANYPYKNLIDAIYSYNFSEYIKYRQIQIVGSGTYKITGLRKLRADIFSDVANVAINIDFNVANTKLHIEGTDANQITINMINVQVFANNSDITLANVVVNYSLPQAMGFNNSNIKFDKCTMNLDTALIWFDDCIANLNFRAFTSNRSDGKYITAGRNNIVLIADPTNIIPTNAINKNYSLVMRYDNVNFS